jgi:kinetochore protein NNF1
MDALSTAGAAAAAASSTNPPENDLGPAPITSAVMDRRATTFVDLFDRALDATLKKISYENFAACFPTTAQYRPETLKKFWQDFVDRLGEKSKVGSLLPRV